MDGSNETNNSSSSFSALPIPLQHKILQLVSSNKDIKTMRLISPEWYRMVNHIHPLPSYRLLNNYNTLEILKKIVHPKISRLWVQYYTQLLPIYSSRRCNIPKTSSLELWAGISAKNIIKLLIYYAKSCSALFLYDNSLGNLQSYRLKGCLRYENLRCLLICFQAVPVFQGDKHDLHDPLTSRNHLIALTQFMQSVKAINLQELQIFTPKVSSEEDSYLYTKFSNSISSFLEKHGQQLVYFTYRGVPFTVIEYFKYLTNLEILDISFYKTLPNGENVNCFDFNQSLFVDLKKLKSLIFLDDDIIPTHLEVITRILTDYRKTIKKFSILSSDDFIYDWILRNHAFELEELVITLREFGGVIGIFDPNIKLTTISVLEFGIEMGEFIGDWATGLFDWFIAYIPNLTKMIFITPSAVNLADLTLLINSLACLKRLIISPSRYIYGVVLTEDAQNWFTQNHGNGFIKVLQREFASNSESQKEYEVLIKRPLPNYIFD